MVVPTPSVRLFVSALAAASEMRNEPLANKIVELPELMTAVPHFVVALPAFEVRVEGGNQVFGGRAAVLRPGEFSDLLPLLGHCFIRRIHGPIAVRSSVKVPRVSEGVAQEAEGCPFFLEPNRAGLFA